MIRRFFGSTVRQQGSSFNMLDYNPAVWLDAQDAGSVILTSGKVSQWSDKSINLNHAIQTDPARRLSYGTSIVSNGFSSMQIPDTSGGLCFDFTSTFSFAELIMVMAYKDGTASTFSDFNGFAWSNDNSWRIAGRRDFGRISEFNDPAEFRQVSKNGGVLSDSCLPLPLTVCNFRGPQVTGPFTLLNQFNNNFRNFSGCTGEVVFFTNQLSEADRTEIINHLMTKWGI